MWSSALNWVTPVWRRRWLRWTALVIIGLLALVFYREIRLAGGAVSAQGNAYLGPGLAVALVAIIGAWLELFPGAMVKGGALRNRWILGLEMGVIIVLGFAFRAVFLFISPAISHDAYRYVWDAHLVSHGVSPYLNAALDPALAPLRDHAIWPMVSWPNSPTVYPPGAQVLFLLVNAIAPLNITAMQLAMAACDCGTGIITLLLLRHYRLDPRRIIVYWWNPIPILEFVYSAHVDSAATLCVAAALLLALQRWRGARLLAGVALGMAALIKLYPLLFVVVLLRRRDYGFLAGLCLTLVVVCLPFVRLGLGGGGFLTTYFSQRFVDQGIIFRLITQVFIDRRLQYGLQATVLALLTGLVLYLRLKQRLRTAAAILALSAVWIVVSPHLFPWYVGGLLPFLALYLRLPYPSAAIRIKPVPSAGDLSGNTPEPALALWLFVLAMPFTYVIFTPGYNANLFLLFFTVPLALAGIPHLRRRWSSVATAPALAYPGERHPPPVQGL
jgi:Glycosyltransferase family 87